ncbi:MAG: M23 family metallopeptidase [Spirochaetes bacterium]|nr:M23 family metallopeptidase [Spirochaetota bacterium]
MKLFSILMLLAGLNLSSDYEKNKGSIIIGSDTIQKIKYSTSSTYGINHQGRKAMDSDYNSNWTSDSKGPHWIEIDFSAKRIMDKIIIYPGKKDNYYTIKKFTLQFMHSDKWFDFARMEVPEAEKGFFSFSNKKNYKKKIEIDLGGIDASKFRILIPEDDTFNGYASIAEIETYIGSNKLKYFDDRLIGMIMPIRNGLLPEKNKHYPNAPRKYRGGVHAGLDILDYHDDENYKPVSVSKDTPVLAVKDGVIIRADWNYKPMTPEEWLNQSEYYRKNPRTFVKRSFGGIQVWIDHENGIVTTYNHLSEIDSKIKKGVRVKQGDVIGKAGNSGLIGEAEGKNYGIHLHFEIWVDGYYLGKGMSMKDVREYFTWIFLLR